MGKIQKYSVPTKSYILQNEKITKHYCSVCVYAHGFMCKGVILETLTFWNKNITIMEQIICSEL